MNTSNPTQLDPRRRSGVTSRAAWEHPRPRPRPHHHSRATSAGSRAGSFTSSLYGGPAENDWYSKQPLSTSQRLHEQAMQEHDEVRKVSGSTRAAQVLSILALATGSIMASPGAFFEI
jgi:hypothetical protein